jgi:hypothetical protein
MNVQVILFLVLFLLNCLAMFLFFLFLKSRFARTKILADLRFEVDKLIVDLGREADRDVALLENRIQNLRALIDEADRRIVLADRETAKRAENEKIMSGVHESSGTRGSTPVPKNEPDPVYVRTAFQDRNEMASNNNTRKSEPITVYTRPSVRRSDTPLEPFVPLQERVLDMVRKGISAEMIASTMSVSLGEVELIIAMNNSSL